MFQVARAGGAGLAMVVTLLVAACAPSPLNNSSCLPSPLEVTPQNVVAGTALTVTAPRFACNASYPFGKTYRLTLGLVGRAAPVDLGSFPVNADGSFHAVVNIPGSAPAGEAAIIVTGSPLDNCKDTNASCAGYVGGFTILAASG